MALQVGQRIEVIGVESGFENSYFAGVILGIHGEFLEVQYETLSAPNQMPLREMIEIEHVRPYPRRVMVDYQEGDVVDVWANGGWWEGAITDIIPDDGGHLFYEVYFDYMVRDQQYSYYSRRSMRIHQNWTMVNFRSVWMYVTGMKRVVDE